MLRRLAALCFAVPLSVSACTPAPASIEDLAPEGAGGAWGGTTSTGGSSAGGFGAGATGAGGETGRGGAGGAACVPAAEACDGLDNDCNGVVDDGCACHAGQEQDCYSGPAKTAGVGACKGGKQTCDAAGAWGACVGEVVPLAKEKCNGADDDCNGKADDLPEQTCGVGGCAVTVPACEGGKPVSCVPTAPKAETCNGVDDNCNQLVDELFPGKGQPCDTGLPGVCQKGTNQCVTDNGATAEQCAPTVPPSAETCNGLDDDCNGQVDDVQGAGVACSTGLMGACAAGTMACSGGGLACVPKVVPGAESCNGQDDDCDGVPDNGNPGGGAACATGLLGACAAGVLTCQNGALSCVQSVQAAPESCNGLDDDCNGVPDDGAVGGGGACVTGLSGICSAGTMTCKGGGLSCTQNQAAKAEVCGNGLDDDCNGAVDNGCGGGQCAHDVCVSGLALVKACSACATAVCNADSYCCSGSWDSICVGEVPTYCGQSCNGGGFTCSHPICSTGSSLVSGCDSGQGNCVQSVCAQDSFCCSTSWDSFCVSEVTSVCGKSCP